MSVHVVMPSTTGRLQDLHNCRRCRYGPVPDWANVQAMSSRPFDRSLLHGAQTILMSLPSAPRLFSRALARSWSSSPSSGCYYELRSIAKSSSRDLLRDAASSNSPEIPLPPSERLRASPVLGYQSRSLTMRKDLSWCGRRDRHIFDERAYFMPSRRRV